MTLAPTLHICNTFFEIELECPDEKPLAVWMRSHPVIRKLQMLPLHYAAPEDLVLVSHLPENPDPRLRLIDAPFAAGKIEHWGFSRAIDAWAKERKIPYSMPDWETISTINSKIFSYSHSPALSGSTLLYSEKEALDWIEKKPGKKVLKTAFGTAGRGHFHIPGNTHKILNYFGNAVTKNVPLIGEPWVERTLDFSTQWKDSKFLGATVIENAPNGSYRSTLTGPQRQIFGPYEWALEEHLAIAKPVLEKISKLGFFGNLGIDAYVYRWEGKEILQPIVEINGRKTMSWAALQIQKKTAPDRCLSFTFSPEQGIFHSQC